MGQVPDTEIYRDVSTVQGVSMDTLKKLYVIFSSSHLEQIIVLKEYCTYNKPISNLQHVKTLQNLSKMRYKEQYESKKIMNSLFFKRRLWCK